MQQRFWQWFGRMVLGHPVTTLLLLTVVAGSLISFAPGIATEFSFRKFFPDQDPEVVYYRDIMSRFGQDDTFAVIALRHRELFGEEAITAIDEAGESLLGLTVQQIEKKFPDAWADLPEDLRQQPCVEEIQSLAEAVHIHAAGSDELAVETVKLNMPQTPEGWQKLKAYVTGSELYKNALVSEDGKTTALVVRLNKAFNTANIRPPVMWYIDTVAQSLEDKGFEVHTGGIPFVRHRYASIIRSTTGRLAALAGLFLLLVLIFVFRRPAGFLLPEMVVMLALGSTTGIMAIAGWPLTILTTVMPIIVLIVGVANSVHFQTRYYEELLAGRSKRDALMASIEHLGMACFITSFTTIVGFLVLLLTEISLLRQFGVVVAFGVAAAYIYTMTLLPAMLWLLPTPPRKSLETYFRGGSGRMIEAIIHGIEQRRALLVVLVLLVLGASVGGSLMVSKSMRLFEDLPAEHPIIAANTFLEKHLGGVVPFDLVMRTEQEGGFKNPELLRFADAAKTQLSSYDAVGKVFGLADFVKELNGALHEDKAEHRRIPDTRNQVAQELLLFDVSTDGEHHPLEPLVREDYSLVRVSARMKDRYSEEVLPMFADIEAWVADNAPQEVSVHLTGTGPIAHTVNLYIVDEIFYTFLLAFLVITLLLWWQFKSLKASLLALAPNMLPLFALLGAMGILGIRLKPSTAVIFSIAFGIAVDDTVHFMARFLSEHRGGLDIPDAVKTALRGTGKAMFFTTIILVGGFTTSYFSVLEANRNFGILTSITLTIALFGDLVLMPLVLVKFRPQLLPKDKTLESQEDPAKKAA